jgi:hypothetical protein
MNLYGWCGGVVGESSNDFFPAVFGASTSPGVGVIGTSLPIATNYNQNIPGAGIGVYGEGYYGAGVYGQSDSAGSSGSYPGVFGISGTSTNCSSGYSGCGVGVQGASHGGRAVQGEDGAGGYGGYFTSSTAIGVYGVTESGVTTATGPYGVYGSNSNGDAIHAVYNGTGGSSAVAGIASTTLPVRTASTDARPACR